MYVQQCPLCIQPNPSIPSVSASLSHSCSIPQHAAPPHLASARSAASSSARRTRAAVPPAAASPAAPAASCSSCTSSQVCSMNCSTTSTASCKENRARCATASDRAAAGPPASSIASARCDFPKKEGSTGVDGSAAAMQDAERHSTRPSSG